MSNFNKIIKRKNTNCVKYDELKEYFDDENLQPMWVADMDFASPKFIKKAFQKRLRHQNYGYGTTNNNVYKSIINWHKTQENYDIKQESITITNGAISSISACIEAFTQKNDEILIISPVYHYFEKVILANERKVLKNRLKSTKISTKDNKRYDIDFKALQNQITSDTKMLIFCSPQNPTGNIWGKKTLEKLGNFCLKNNIIIVSDEVHSGLVFKKFHSFGTLRSKIRQNTIIINGIGKTFNLSGIHGAYAICFDEQKNKLFQKIAHKRGVEQVNIFALIAIQQCYTKGQNWLKNVKKYIHKNIKFTKKYIEKNTKNIIVDKVDATYLVWLDFSNIPLSHKQIKNILEKKCKIALSDGLAFDKKLGHKHFRLNVALPKAQLKIALQKIEKHFKSI